MATEIAPIVLADAVADEAIGQSAVADRAGDVEGAVSATSGVGVGRTEQRDRAVLVQLRTLADGVDDAAGIHDAAEQRGRTLQHLDALDGGVEAAALHQRHAVAHDRAVAVVTEAAAKHGVLGAGERVGLDDAVAIDQRVIEIPGQLVLQHLLRHDVDRLRRVERRGATAQRGRTRHRAIGELGFVAGCCCGSGALGRRRWCRRRGALGALPHRGGLHGCRSRRGSHRLAPTRRIDRHRRQVRAGLREADRARE
jgi:hypothetical protein